MRPEPAHMHPRDFSMDSFQYSLPVDRIAAHPLPQRDASRLLWYEQAIIRDAQFADLPELLPEGSALLFNDSRVLPARLLFRKPSGGWVELFCLEPHDRRQEISGALEQEGESIWNCLIGGASKWKRGQVLEKSAELAGREVVLQARFIFKESDYFSIGFSWVPQSIPFAAILQLFGSVPLPPYLGRQAEPEDRERYQTIYGHREGSVAAPTAGLHFTDSVLNRLEEKKIAMRFVTLHVGAGTFKPVISPTLDGHTMHEEAIEVSRSTLFLLQQQDPRSLIAVGTTSLRTLESLYWLGWKTIDNPHLSPESLHLGQWDAYSVDPNGMPAETAFRGLLEWLDRNQLSTLFARTRLLIAPGYLIRTARGLLTNFHQPGSTLLLLVAAFIGEDWKRIYAHAVEKNYRMLSYGDCSLLFRN
jgi:S-adenosylmethionine:tRNA ribosyltransferase-isomerase